MTEVHKKHVIDARGIVETLRCTARPFHLDRGKKASLILSAAVWVPLDVWSPDTVQKLLLSVLGLAVIVAGIAVVSRAGKANYAETARIGFNVIVGIVIAALGAGTISFAVFGASILRFFGFSTE